MMCCPGETARRCACMRRSTRRSASIWKSRSGITSPPALSRNKRGGARVRWIEDLFHDLRYAVRTQRRSPAFAAVAVLSLALGIGANTAIFSLIDAVMLRMLPVREPARLLQTTRFWGARPGSFSYPLFEQLRESNELPQEPRIPPIFAGFSPRRPAGPPGSGPHRRNSPCAEDHGREASPSPGAPAVGSQEDAAGNQNRLIAV